MVPGDIPGSAALPSGAAEAEFRSILFERPEDAAGVDELDEPDFFGDLNLDRVVTSLTAGREQYQLRPLFYAPLHQVSSVRYRHEVLRDLEQPEVRESVNEFAESMRQMRTHLERARELRYPLQRQSWFVDAVGIYCAAVQTFAGDLTGHDLGSRGLRGLREYLAGYVASAPFTGLASETAAVKDALASVRYMVRSNGDRVTVVDYHDEPDYGAQVQQTFAKFRQGAVDSYLAKLSDYVEMNHIEAQILDGVARLHPEEFRAREQFCARHREYVDVTITRFDREVQFYLGYLELIDRLRSVGLSFCYPQVSTRAKEIAASDTFDIALAGKLAGRGIVTNDFHLAGSERVFVVSGPNNGGKTTFARTFGQLPYLASLGLPVPGREARLFLPDRIFTHFEREEDIQTLRGKFDDELVRVRAILEQASPSSVIVMNESFNSTSLQDALFVGTEVMRQVLELGCLGVYVTFVDEIASLSEATVSMVSQIARDDPARRTFKVIRQPADGRAYAWAIAEKYGLSYQRLMQRVGT